jgi:HD superfamily phosphodiesterase
MNILKEVEKYTLQYYEENFSSLHTYHSVEHTRLVVDMATKISGFEGLDKRNTEIVMVAAWFHDIGYAISHEHHEDESCQIARQFLTGKGVDEDFILAVEACISSTRRGAEIKSLNDKILHDADHAHTALPDFMEISNLFRKEQENFSDRKMTKLEYWKKTLDFLNETKFLTEYAIKNMEPEKNENIRKVEKRIKEVKTTARGIETMFRLTARNQINLSSIADNKANIMLTINAVIVSVLVSTSALNFTAGHGLNFLVPGLILVSGCLISLVFSVLSVRPKIITSKHQDEDVKNQKVNLLFFGNFFKMDYDEYERAVKEMMDDYDYLYGTMIKDQYQLGKVLSIKYRLLKYSYNFFMYSFVVAVITFFVMYLGVV